MSHLRQVPPALFLIVFFASAAYADVVNVNIVGISFSPQSVTIKEGDTVVWTNGSPLIHTVTSGSACTGDGTFNSGNLGQSATFQWTFNEAGTVPYFCIPHCFGGMTGTVIVEPAPTGIGDVPTHSAALRQNYPNPFNPTTSIEYSVVRTSRIEIAVYNAAGRLVRNLENTERTPGTYVVEWNGRNTAGVAQASGVYYYRLLIDGVFADTRRMVLLK